MTTDAKRNQARLLEAIEDAIKLDQISAHWEGMIERDEPAAVNALLPDAVADRVLRAQTEIDRHFIRKLEGLELYRRLRET